MRTRTGCDRDHRRAGGLCSEASRTAAGADAATKLARVTAAPPTARFDLDIEGVPRTQRAQALLDAVHERVVIADGAMGTMLQRHDLSIQDDFAGLELIYRITERFRLRTETGTSQSIDLLYERNSREDTPLAETETAFEDDEPAASPEPQ